MEEFNKDEFIEDIIQKYGEKQIEDFISTNYSGDCEKISELNDLYSLEEEEIKQFTDEYEEYLEERELVEEEMEQWDDYMD